MAMADNKAKVLVIDDDIDFLETSEATLVAAGYSVATARTGDEGLSLAREMRPDVVILDLWMEHADAGFVVAHHMRRDPELARVPVIMVTSVARDTGYRFDLNSEESRRWIKVDRIMNKPVTSAELLTRVAEALAPSTA